MIRTPEELAALLHDLAPFIERRAKEILKVNTALFQGLAQVYAPVKTGYMRNHITLTDYGDSVEVTSEAPYSVYVEARTPFMMPAWAQVEPQLKEQMENLQREIDGFVSQH